MNLQALGRSEDMVIKLPGCDWRIRGSETDWQIEYPYTDKNGDEKWKGRYFHRSLAHSIEKAYEVALRESPETAADLKAALAECRRVKAELLDAVKGATA